LNKSSNAFMATPRCGEGLGAEAGDQVGTSSLAPHLMPYPPYFKKQNPV
jgi:hypothetical protein